MGDDFDVEGGESLLHLHVERKRVGDVVVQEQKQKVTDTCRSSLHDGIWGGRKSPTACGSPTSTEDNGMVNMFAWLDESINSMNSKLYTQSAIISVAQNNS